MTSTSAENPHAAIPRYPLEWPLGWQRKTFLQRRHATFQMTREDRQTDGSVRKRKTDVSVLVATDRLETQLNLLGAGSPVLSTNVSLNLRGIPRGDENPSDPGVAVYFTFRGRATVLACDSFYRVADNIAALANHIDALRRIERYGVGTIEQALAGYKALPADTAADWRSAFGYTKTDRVTHDDLDHRFKAMARDRHPDFTHDDGAAMAWLNRARDFALQALGGDGS